MFEKSDPYGFAAELPPRTASKVADLNRYAWNDGDWMASRAQDQLARRSRCRSTKSIWAVGSGPATIRTRWLNYRELAHQLVDYCKEMGYTHLELMPVSEHPFYGQLGLSDGRLLRGHQPLRHAAKTSCTSSITATRTASA